MKERVVLFSDAVIAIILTIMVLELPIEHNSNGAVDFSSLFSSIGIYFISFCFVANLWFQTANSFNRIEKVKNKDLVIYMLLLFFLSLVPSATRLLIEDTNRQTIIIYGILTLIVTLIMRRLNFVLTTQTIKERALKKRYQDELNRQDILSIFSRLLLIVFSFFFIKTALIIYLILPILAFLQNMIDREENDFVDTLNEEQQIQYFNDRDHLWGSSFKRYAQLFRNSLEEEAGENPDRWKEVIGGWTEQIEREIEYRKKELQSETPADPKKLNHEIQQLEQQKERLLKQKERLEQKNSRDKK